MRFTDASFGPIAVADRSGLDESLHHGAGVAIAGGTPVASVGDPDLVVYPRSALKPLQASAMLELGLDVPDDLLAVACASHDGSEVHLAAVRRLLAMFELSESDLANTPARPYGAAARADARRRGVEPSSIQQNCSGKHAAMLATCRVNGWPTDGYIAPDHPLQLAITGWIERQGIAVHHIGVDGCGAATHAVSMRELATVFAEIAASGSPVPRAMAGHPELVGGPDRDVTIWMRAAPGLIAKEGAAGVMAVATHGGAAAVFKIADGSDAARQAVVPEAIRHLGLDVDGAFGPTATSVEVPTLGHGRPVGTVRPMEWTRWSS